MLKRLGSRCFHHGDNGAASIYHHRITVIFCNHHPYSVYRRPIIGPAAVVYTYTCDYMYTYTLCKYSMQAIPESVQLLYTANTRPYTIGSYSTTQREFQVDPLLDPKPVAFVPLAPLLVPKFQVDKII